MKHLTRLLALLLALALLASCSPSADPDTSYAPASTPPSTDTSAPPDGATSPTEPSPDADTQTDTPNPDGSPASTAPAPPDTSASPDPHAEHETAILAAMETIDPASFLWMHEFFLARDDAGTEYLGHLLGKYEQELHAAEYPGAEVPLFTVDAFTDENGAWRSGEHGSGVDAETADFYLGWLRTFLEPDEDDDPDAAPPADPLHPIAGMTFDYESGVLLRNYPCSDFGSSHNLIYIEATAPDAEPFDPPIQLFYALERMDSGYAFSCVLLFYNEGYGWSTLEG